MPVDRETFAQKVEEFKEVGHEYRYRDQLMVQEFSLSMIAAGVVINALVPRLGTIVGVTIQVFGLMFLVLLTLHLRNINQDRLAALARKEVLRTQLEFGPVHQNPVGTHRLSAPRLMVWFARAVAVAWAIWTAVSIRSALTNYV